MDQTTIQDLEKMVWEIGQERIFLRVIGRHFTVIENAHLIMTGYLSDSGLYGVRLTIEVY